MITAQEAQQYINDSLIQLTSAEVGIQDSTGSILNQKIVADRDFPPFDRVMMDGIAISWESYNQGFREYTVQDLHPAGSPAPSLRADRNLF
jgi:molybdopterin molybdotransferase